MNLEFQILIGMLAGFIFAFFSVAGAINSKEKEVKISYKLLIEALNIRYLKLKNVLNFLKKHMTDCNSEIESLVAVCEEAYEADDKIKNIKNRIDLENKINYHLEGVKSNMAKYPSLQADDEVNNAIIAIAESEIFVGEAIKTYNSFILEYNVLIETFPVSLVAWILNKDTQSLPFTVSDVKEFDDSYIDEDEV